MSGALLAVLLAAPGAGAAAIAASTAAVAAPALKRPPLHAVLHRDAAGWKPLSLREGGDPDAARSAVALRLAKVKGRLKGENSPAKAFARVHRGPKDSRWLVVSVHPRSLERRRTHLELRFRIFEGYVEEAAAAAVTVIERRRAPSSPLLDAFDLRAEGVEYREEQTGSGALVVSALDPRPRADARNSGRLEKAEFSDKALGLISLSWSARGVSEEP